jgi:hypothetical protein
MTVNPRMEARAKVLLAVALECEVSEMDYVTDHIVEQQVLDCGIVCISA